MAADTLSKRPSSAKTAAGKTPPKTSQKPAQKAGPRPAAKVTPKRIARPLVNEATETLKRTRDSVTHVSGEYAAICSDTLAAAMETGSLTSKRLVEMNQTYMEACTGTLSAFAEISRDSLACRTPADLLALQQKAAEAVTASVNTTSKFYGGLFAVFSQAMDPLVARASYAPERLFKALAD